MVAILDSRHAAKVIAANGTSAITNSPPTSTSRSTSSPVAGSSTANGPTGNASDTSTTVTPATSTATARLTAGATNVASAPSRGVEPSTRAIVTVLRCDPTLRTSASPASLTAPPNPRGPETPHLI